MASLFDVQYVAANYASTTQNYDTNVYELDETSPRTEYTSETVALKPHQQSMLYQCMKLESGNIHLTEFSQIADQCLENDYMNTKLGIIADRVGSGKSYVILALIAQNQLVDQDDIIVKSFGYNNVVFNVSRKSRMIKTNVLVVPHNIVNQWSDYIGLFPTLNALVVNKKTFTSLQEKEIQVTDYDVIVITPTYYNKFSALIQDEHFTFQRVIYDEIDSLNLPSCRSLHARFFWLVTASYGNILYPRGFTRWEPNVRRYIWCAQGIVHSGFIKNMLLDICHNIPRKLVSLIIVKNKDEYIQQSIELPPVNKHFIQCKTPRTIRILNGLVDRNVIECLNADNVQGAIAYVSPSNKVSEANIIDLMVHKYETQLKNLVLRRTHAEQYEYESEAEKTTEIEKFTVKITELEGKMDMIKRRIAESSTCIICYDDIQNKTITTCCQNSFCFKCINIWLARTSSCPLCKSPTALNDLYVVSNDASSSTLTSIAHEEEHDPNTLSPHWDKYTNLRILLQNRAPNSKFLIFSSHDGTFVKIYDSLLQLGIRFEHLKGNGNVVKSTVNRYKNGELDALLVNSSHYGSGLNLENTTDIVMFHKFDTEIEHQVIGRADRFGRTIPLNIWYLLYENENVHVQAQGQAQAQEQSTTVNHTQVPPPNSS